MVMKTWWDLPRRSVVAGCGEGPDGAGTGNGDGDAERVYAVCKTANHASCKVLRKSGFEVVKEMYICVGYEKAEGIERARQKGLRKDRTYTYTRIITGQLVNVPQAAAALRQKKKNNYLLLMVWRPGYW
ncbi:hypothetical protein GX48_08339 [Paracoccidioides brasiliensis]|nr:hypothetical protein GX48_08339 [Paracoccidioides brasiliensis]